MKRSVIDSWLTLTRWRTRGIIPHNSFNTFGFCLNRPSRYSERSWIASKPSYKVIVSGSAKPPCTNRGVSHGEYKALLCPVCTQETGFYTDTDTLYSASPCYSCLDPDLIPF